MLIYVSAYTPGGVGGISTFHQDAATGELTTAHPVTRATDPSFLAWHPDGAHLYAVSESAGDVLAFARDPDGHLTSLGVEWTGGIDPCHLCVDPTGSFLITANYSDGTISVHPIKSDGSLGSRRDLLAHRGGGPDPERQLGPHAHMVAYRPGGGSFFVSDLGTDQIHEYALSPDGAVRPLDVCSLPAGCGPRHIAFHPSSDLVFVSAELDSSVQICRLGAGGLHRTGRVAATAAPPGTVNYPSHIECSLDGRFLYVANRGADCLTVFEVTAGGLRALADVPTGGAWPRHFALVGDFLYVANQNSGDVTAARLDPATGIPGKAAIVATVPHASCILAEPTEPAEPTER